MYVGRKRQKNLKRLDSISLHIEYLLLRHDCVIVPGFGAFVNTPIAAHYDNDENIWYPMRDEISFNSAISSDDGLLANSYSRKYDLSFEKARILLDSDIRELKEKLEEDGEITIGRLGIIRKYEDSRIEFIPRLRGDDNARQYGFVAVGVESKNTEKELEADASVCEARGVYKREFRFDTTRNYYIPVNKVFAKVAASLLIVIAVGLAVMVPASDRENENRASVVPVEKIVDTTRKAISRSENIVAKMSAGGGDKVADSNDNDVADAESRNVSTSDADAGYYLIVGTFKAETEANNFKEVNSAKGYNLQIIKGKTLCRVSAGSSSRIEDLQQIMRSDSFKKAFSESWIWKK